MSTMMADVINAGTGSARAQPRLHAAGRRQDRHDQRLQRRVVHRVHAEARDRRLGRVRSAAHDSAERLCRRRRRADLGEVHESGDAGTTSPSGFAARRRSSPPASAGCPASWRPNGARTSTSSTRTASSSADRWSTPSTSRAAPSRRRTATAHQPRHRHVAGSRTTFGGQQQSAPHAAAPGVAPPAPTGTAGTTATPGTTGTTIEQHRHAAGEVRSGSAASGGGSSAAAATTSRRRTTATTAAEAAGRGLGSKFS